MAENELTNLKTFFKLVNHQKRKKKALTNSKNPKRAPKKLYNFVTLPDKYILQDPYSKDEIESQKRIKKINMKETLKNYNLKQSQIKKEILKKKYEFLFEYRSMDKYESDFELFFQPKEKEIQDLEDKKEKLKKYMEKQEEQEKETLQEIHSALNVFQEKLKSIDTDESREEDALELKRLDMRDYILKQKELYKFKENEKTNIDINPNIFHKRQKSSNIAFIPQVVNRSQIIPPKITPSKLIFETPKTEKIISRGEESKINSEEPENNEIEETKEERTNLFEEKEDV
jgi:hypothetical protein